MPALTDPRGWTTTKEVQEAGIYLIASLTDAAVKGAMQRGAHGQELMKLVAASQESRITAWWAVGKLTR